MYNEDLNELYHVCWRPQRVPAEPLEENPFPSVPNPHPSALKYLGSVKTPSKPAGAYRPPGARGQDTPLAFKREDEGGAALISNHVNGFGKVIEFGKAKRRIVPGSEAKDERLPPGAAPGGGVSLTGTGEGMDGLPMPKAAKKNLKKRKTKEAAAAAALNDEANSTTFVSSLAVPTGQAASSSPEREETGKVIRSRRQSTPRPNGTLKGPITIQKHEIPTTLNKAAPAASNLCESSEAHIASPHNPESAENRKIRGLLKKLRAIDDLKMRLAGGEKLEGTQMKKIDSENRVREELRQLGYDG